MNSILIIPHFPTQHHRHHSLFALTSHLEHGGNISFGCLFLQTWKTHNSVTRLSITHLRVISCDSIKVVTLFHIRSILRTLSDQDKRCQTTNRLQGMRFGLFSSTPSDRPHINDHAAIQNLFLSSCLFLAPILSRT
jgi:hypothetical protein